MLQNKVILIISPDNWNFLPVSKHHYAIELAKKNMVYFLPPPSSGEKDYQEKGVKIINNYRKIRGINKLPICSRKLVMQIEVTSILKKIHNKEIDIVWSYDTSRLYYLELFKAKIKIAHIVDYSEHFHFKELIASSDFCFATSDSITDKMKKYNSNVFKINHGFFPTEITTQPTLKEIKEAVYIGNLNIKYLDWKTVYLLTNNYPNINFNFYGTLNQGGEFSNKEFFLKVFNSTNAFFHGKISPEKVNKVLKSADFCFACYLHEEYPLQLQNPHKIMQYLGSGTPLFSSFSHEYKDLDLFPMYQNDIDILEIFNKFLNNDFNDFNKESSNKRINFALENTYSKQIERIEKIIFKK